MKYYHQPYDGHRELYAITDIDMRYVCADCSNRWSPATSLKDEYFDFSNNPQVPDSVVLLLGVELL